MSCLPARSAEMACDEAEALLPLVADGALDADGDPALFAHLAACRRCQDSLAHHDLVELALARGASGVGVGRTIRLPLPWAVATAATLALAAGAGAWLLNARATAAPVVAEQPRILRLPDEGDGRSRYLVIDGGRTMVVDPAAADGGAPVDQGPWRPIPVGSYSR